MFKNADATGARFDVAQQRNNINSPMQYANILRVGKIDLNKNAQTAKNMFTIAFAVTNPRVWDYKNNRDLQTALQADGSYSAKQLANFGNWHFGFVSAANGNSLGFSLHGAGIFQSFYQGGGSPSDAVWGGLVMYNGYREFESRSITNQGFTWGDNADDPMPIMHGWDYYHER